MTDQDTLNREMAAKAQRVFIRAADMMASHGLSTEQAANGALWAAIDIACRDMPKPLASEWLRDIADRMEAEMIDDVELPPTLQ